MQKVEAEIWIDKRTSWMNSPKEIGIDWCTQDFRRQEREGNKGEFHRSAILVTNQAMISRRSKSSDRPKERMIMAEAW